MSSSWMSSSSGAWGFGRRVVDPEQARREAETIATAPPEWPTFTGPKVFESSSDMEVVPNLSEFSVEIQLQPTDEPLSVFYEFQTQAEEGFGLTGAGVKGNMAFRIDLVNATRGELMELLETRLYQSHLQVVRGERKLPRLKSPCKLQLVFDNTHSMMKDKKLAYKVVVVHHRYIDGRDVETPMLGDSSGGPGDPVAKAATVPLVPTQAPGPTPALQNSVEQQVGFTAETIRAFYREHAPEKSQEDVQMVIDKYSGQEEKLMRKLRKKYIKKPAAAALAGDGGAPVVAAGGSSTLDTSIPQSEPMAQQLADDAAPEFEEVQGEWM